MTNIPDIPKPALNNIKSFIDNKKSFCFDSGAGSGKTFTLVQTVNYILAQYGNELERRNQRIMVITYTNAATNEIIDQIGNTKLLDISTIHTRLWALVKRFQKQLVQIHLKNIEEKVDELKPLVEGDPYYQDEVLMASIEDSNFKSKFYKYRSLNAPKFKELFKIYSSGNIPSVDKFKKFVNNTFNYLKLANAADKIRHGDRGYTKVEYDPLYNYDRLHRMKFSHDTLIKYSLDLIQSSEILQRIIIDTYPYILVDEYQDTAPDVVRILSIVDTASAKAGADKCVVGYYGDSCQHIFDTGIGTKLYNLHTGLKKITHFTNRRSLPEIVSIANKIRHDGVEQVSFQQDKHGTIGVLYSTTEDVIDPFIFKSINDFPDSEKVDCLILKNNIVAERMGFGSFYHLLAQSNYYKSRYNQISTEILSDDITKLGQVPLFFYRWIKFYSGLYSHAGVITQYIPRSIYSQLNLFQIKDIRMRMINIKHDNFSDYVNGIRALSEQNPWVKKILEYNVGEESLLNSENIVDYVFENLYSGVADNDIPDGIANATAIANTDIRDLLDWYAYLSGTSNRRVQYHTFHGTKGLGFDNVIIILTNEFKRKKDYFHSYFKSFSDDSKYTDEEFLAKRNLLYVAITRAKKNLRILYVDPYYNEVKVDFENIFGHADEFREESI